MTYKVVQRIGNNYYLYSVEGMWDPEKKNSKQKRRYIGPCDKDGNPIPSKRAKRVDPVITDTTLLSSIALCNSIISHGKYLRYSYAIDKSLPCSL